MRTCACWKGISQDPSPLQKLYCFNESANGTKSQEQERGRNCLPKKIAQDIMKGNRGVSTAAEKGGQTNDAKSDGPAAGMSPAVFPECLRTGRPRGGGILRPCVGQQFDSAGARARFLWGEQPPPRSRKNHRFPPARWSGRTATSWRPSSVRKITADWSCRCGAPRDILP